MAERKLKGGRRQRHLVTGADRLDAADALKHRLGRRPGVEGCTLDGAGGEDAGIVGAADVVTLVARCSPQRQRPCSANCSGEQEIVELLATTSWTGLVADADADSSVAWKHNSSPPSPCRCP